MLSSPFVPVYSLARFVTPEWLTNPLTRKEVFGMKQEVAEIAAMRALGWLVGAGRSGRGVPGLQWRKGLDDLRARAAEPEFLASVLDFILMDDAWVMDCARPRSEWRPSNWSNCARRCRAAGCRTGRDQGNPRVGRNA
jgi:hypothetical protein